MYGQERKFKIMDCLKQQGSVSVNELAALLSASRETIRRDLRELEAQGLLTRTHGGAYASDNGMELTASASPGHLVTGNEYPFSVRQGVQVEAKRKIAAKAASFLQDRDTIFIDNSSTTFYLLDYLPRDMHLIVITNSIRILMESSRVENPNISFIMLAGLYNSYNYSVYGRPALKSVEDFYPDKAFISCAGVTPERGLTDQGLNEIDIRLTILRKAKTTYLLADNTKLTKNEPFHLAGLEEIDCIITNHYGDKPELSGIVQTITSRYKIPVIIG